MKKLLMWLAVLWTFSVITACSGAATDSGAQTDEGKKIKVTSTTSQVGDIVNHVGGEYVEADSLMGPGTDPHLYQATQQDIGKLSEADLIFYNGLHLEGKMGEILEKMQDQKPVRAVSDAVPEEKLIKEGKDAYDPHIWFDAGLWQYAVDEVVEGLSEVDPEHADQYAANGDSYKNELAEVDEWAKEMLADIPEQSRVLVTAHDAFHYFGNAYDIEVKGLQGLSTDSEYGIKDVQNIVNLLVEREIKAVFVESSISERSINAVVEGAKEKGHDVVIGGELYSDAMGEEGTEEGTYIGMFKHNIRTIQQSLK
ncbi:metal ABC transporter solute-binding protein, Zn/Mn family [Siminovitchia sediminis]|uniref:Metal ABC transporter solute-binding protein, Zn/Mn family n=1 Tax=Siminovitchia sediminis TaxID=1274353 RepID=A0ABW4KF20_9BACI